MVKLIRIFKKIFSSVRFRFHKLKTKKIKKSNQAETNPIKKVKKKPQKTM